jgi:hypothetical protein
VYVDGVTVVGGTPPYEFVTDPSKLPPGVGLEGGDGTLIGIPTKAGQYEFTITATDHASCQVSGDYISIVDDVTCHVVILPGPQVLDQMPAGQEFSQKFNGADGTPPYTFRAFNLPDGLEMSASGTISGAPTTPGGYSGYIVVTDAAGCEDFAQFFYQVTAPCDPPLLFEGGTSGQWYYGEVRAGDGGYELGVAKIEGGTPPYTATVTGNPPPGITPVIAVVPPEIPNTFRLNGTFSSPGFYSFTITITDDHGCSVDVTVGISVAAGRPPLLSRVSGLVYRAIGGRD